MSAVWVTVKRTIISTQHFNEAGARTPRISTTPAETLADAGLQVAIAAEWLDRFKYSDTHPPAVRTKATVIGRMMRSVFAVIAANCEPHEICRDGYRYTDLDNPFVPPELPVPHQPTELTLIEAAE